MRASILVFFFSSLVISSIANAQSPPGYNDEDMAEFEHEGMFDIIIIIKLIFPILQRTH